MDFEWHDDKQEEVERLRGLTFHDVASVFADPNRLDWQDTRRDYGEERRKTSGLIETLVITVVHTMREDVCHIITAWPSNRKERKSYGTP